jgi:hypothetical protein
MSRFKVGDWVKVKPRVNDKLSGIRFRVTCVQPEIDAHGRLRSNDFATLVSVEFTRPATNERGLTTFYAGLLEPFENGVELMMECL